jgi:hypothetical protein
MRVFAGVGFLVLIIFASSAQAGFKLYNLATKVGLDVVQANDTRHFFVLQADIATVFSPNIRLEIGAETGSGSDLDGTEIQARGGGAYLKYLWPHKSGTAYAYMGGGLGVNRVRRERLIINEFQNEYQAALHFILVGMEKQLLNRRMEILFEVRWVIGEEEDASALRTAVGIGFNIGKP